MRTPIPFQTFLDQHSGAVLAFLRAAVGPVEADDCFQETFLAAMRAYRRMDGRHPRAWVMTIARRKAIDHHRAHARRPEPRADLAEKIRPHARAGDLAQADRGLWEEVASLPPKQRDAVALRFIADLPYREIGAVLDCSEEAARQSVREGLKKLRATLARAREEGQ